MDSQEAYAVLDQELAKYQKLSYADLKAKVGEGECYELTGPSGAEYQVEIEAFWEHKPNGNIMVLGSVDDGGWRAFVPLCRSFTVSPSAPPYP